MRLFWRKNMISIIIPTYNSGGKIGETLECVVSVMEHPSMADFSPYEIIVVDDGSKDDTERLLKTYAERFPSISGIILEHNVGQQNATLAGIRHGKYDYVFTYDDDLKYDPWSLREMILCLKQGCDVVYGVCNSVEKKMLRHVGTQFKEWCFYCFLNKPKQVTLTSYRGMRRSVVEHVMTDLTPSVYLSARILQKKWSVESRQVPAGVDNEHTRYRFKGLVCLMFGILFNYTWVRRIVPFQKKREQYKIKEIYT